MLSTFDLYVKHEINSMSGLLWMVIIKLNIKTLRHQFKSKRLTKK